MIVFPNCKINLGLNVLRKREDGFHDVETFFYPLPLQDALEVISNTISSQSIQFTSSGITIDGNEEDNLCVKAYYLLKRYHPQIPNVKMHLHKAILMGAGLGGGSADGAYTLMVLNEKYQLQLSKEQLINYASQLGSDCAFFIINQPCFAEGRGEIVTPIAIDLSDYTFVVVNPGIHINTSWAYAQLHPTTPSKSIRKIIQQPVNTWKNELVNGFEEVIFKEYPGIAFIKKNLYGKGAVYASMSGSGSSVYGLFEKDNIDFNFPSHYKILRVKAGTKEHDQ